MKFSPYWKVFAVLVLVWPTACFSDFIEWPDCTGPGCQRTATATGWPAPLTDNGYEVLLDQYLIKLPSIPKRIVSEQDGSLLVSSQDGSGITFNVVRNYAPVTNPKTLKRVPQNSNFTVAESSKLIFTRTVDDTQPTDPNDLFVWRQAMFFKSPVFGETNPVYVSQKDDLSIYHYTDPNIPGGLWGYVFDAKISNSYLRVYGEDLSFSRFKKILGTIKLRRVD